MLETYLLTLDTEETLKNKGIYCDVCDLEKKSDWKNKKRVIWNTSYRKKL